MKVRNCTRLVNYMNVANNKTGNHIEYFDHAKSVPYSL